MYEVDEYTVSLLHFDDGIKDETGKVWTAQNGAAVSTTKSKFGGESLYLDGKNQYLTTPNSADFNFGSGDFTVDWWEYRTEIRESASVLSPLINFPSTEISYVIGYGGYSPLSGHCVCFASSNGTSWDMLAPLDLGTIDINTWTHFAFVRKENTFYGFKNGTLISTAVSSASIHSPTSTLMSIGGRKLSDTYHYFPGYIDEFRISNIARWMSDFDPEPVEITNLLRITMNDSSEREYQLTSSEVDKFIAWCNRTVDTGTSYYIFNKVVGSQNSKEYLFFEKIISFEVFKF